VNKQQLIDFHHLRWQHDDWPSVGSSLYYLQPGAAKKNGRRADSAMKSFTKPEPYVLNNHASKLLKSGACEFNLVRKVTAPRDEDFQYSCESSDCAMEKEELRVMAMSIRPLSKIGPVAYRVSSSPTQSIIISTTSISKIIPSVFINPVFRTLKRRPQLTKAFPYSTIDDKYDDKCKLYSRQQ